MCKKQVCLTLTIVLVCAFGAPAVKAAAPGGLKAEYYDSSWIYGTPVVTRIDPQIDFNWGDNAPAPGVKAKSFTVCWTGLLEVPVTGAYTFTIRAGGSVTLLIGGKAVIDRWCAPRATIEDRGTMELTAGQTYPFWMTYHAGEGKTYVQLFCESMSLARQIVPASALWPPLLAEDPSPPDGAVEVVQDVTLKWAPGSRATHHDLYLGADPNAVVNATVASAGVYRGRQPRDATTFNTGPLEWGRTYLLARR